MRPGVVILIVGSATASCGRISFDVHVDGSRDGIETGDASFDGPIDCPNIGDVCSDGTVYVGTSPDGNVPMFT